MTRSELIEFLKESLRVEVSTYPSDYDSNHVRIKVTLRLDDEVIDYDYDTIYIPEDNP